MAVPTSLPAWLREDPEATQPDVNIVGIAPDASASSG
jgi:hypothetical protein